MTEKTKGKNKKTTKKSSAKVRKQTAPIVTVAEQPATDPVKQPAPTARRDDKGAKLHRYSLWLAIVLFVQAAAVIIAGTAKTLPVTVRYLTVDPLSSEAEGHQVMATATRHLYDKPLAWMVAVTLLMLGVTYLLIATRARRQYEADLGRGVDKLKWIGWGLGGGVLISTLALLNGINDVASLVLLFASVLIGCMAGAGLETLGGARPGMRRLLGLIGLVGVVLPWIVLACAVVAAVAFDGHVPGYVYGLDASMLLLFAATWLATQFRLNQRGKFADLTYTECAYMVLTLVTASAFAWQVFAGALQP